MRPSLALLLLALGCSAQPGEQRFTDPEPAGGSSSGGAPLTSAGSHAAPVAGSSSSVAGTGGAPAVGGTGPAASSGGGGSAAGSSATAGQGGMATEPAEGGAGGSPEPVTCSEGWQTFTVQPGYCLAAGVYAWRNDPEKAYVFSATVDTCQPKQTSWLAVRPGAAGQPITISVRIADDAPAELAVFENDEGPADGGVFCGNMAIGVSYN